MAGEVMAGAMAGGATAVATAAASEAAPARAATAAEGMVADRGSSTCLTGRSRWSCRCRLFAWHQRH